MARIEFQPSAGFDLITLHHADLAGAAAMIAKGVLISVLPTTGRDENRQCTIGDPDGNRIEFMQMVPQRTQRVAIALRLHGP